MKSKERKKTHLNSSKEWETLHIDHRVFSRNKIDKMHWAEKGRLKGQYRILIRNQMRLNKIKETESKCKIIINCYVTRLMDLDNVISGLKQFIDALCTENFIWDDAPAWLEIKQIKQFKSKEAKIVVSRLIL